MGRTQTISQALDKSIHQRSQIQKSLPKVELKPIIAVIKPKPKSIHVKKTEEKERLLWREAIEIEKQKQEECGPI